MKKRLALILASAMLVSSAVCSLASCSGGGGSDAKGHVYYLNFKPEQDEQWQALAEAYTEETGITVDVSTAAQGTYETQLASELGKSDAPTLFQVNGPVGLANWKDYCYDLTDADVTKQLKDNSFALKDGEGKVRGVAYVSETYGMIVNTDLLTKAGHSLDEITNFETFKAVVEDITANSKKLGFSAFTNASLKKGEDWRIQTHLANIPLYYEFKADNVSGDDALKVDFQPKGIYLENYRNIIDLYLNNATCAPSVADSKTVDDATQEFADGQAVFFQNGTWAYDGIKDLGDENLQMIPIYIGVEGEENQALCSGTENYWCVNSQAAEEDIQATLDFLNWVVTSETGINSLCDDMGFVVPFKNAKAPNNIFAKQADEYVSAGKTPVTWTAFQCMPSEKWKEDLGSAIATYSKKQNDAAWETVVTNFTDNWKAEKEASASATTDDAEAAE